MSKDKLWTKNVQMTDEIEHFTVGKDREMDLYLAKYDVLGSMAHITMLESIGLIGKTSYKYYWQSFVPFIKRQNLDVL